MTASSEIEQKIKEFGEEITALIAICLDMETPEDMRIILRKELKNLKHQPY